MSDGYLYWRIELGVVEKKTAMPASEKRLDETQIWQLVTFICTLADE